MDASDSEIAPAHRALRRRRLFLLAGILVALLSLYTLAGFLLVPALARRALVSYVARLPGVQLRIDGIAFNPFTLEAQLRGLTLGGAGDAPLVGFRLLNLAISPASLWQRGYVLRQIELLDPTLDARIAGDGRLNLLALIAPSATSGASAAGSGNTPPLRIGILRISGGRVHFEDHSHATPFMTTLTPIDFSLSDFRTRGAGDGHFQLSARAASGESLDLSGTVSMQPLATSGQFALRSLQASTVMAYLGDTLPVALQSGQGELAGSYRFLGAGRDTLSVQLTQLQLTGMAIAARSKGNAEAPWLSIPALALNNVSIELPERRISIDSLAVRQAHVSVWVEPDGSLSLAQEMGTGNVVATNTAATNTVAANAAPVPAWSVSLAKLTLDAARLSLADHSVSPAVALEVGPLQLQAQGYSTSGDRPVSFELASGIGAAGHLQSQGSLMLSPLGGTVNLDLQRFDLTALQPYVHRLTTVTLYRGNLGVHGRLVLGSSAGPGASPQPRMLATGEIDLQDFATRDQLTNMDFVTGRSVRLLQVRYQRDPDALQIGTVRAQGLYGRVVIGNNGSLNLTTLLRPASAAAGVAAGAAPGAAHGAAPAAAAATPAAASMPIRIARVELVGSAANFTDRSVQPIFSAAIEGLHGAIVGLSSDPGSRARVQLAGAVNRYAPVSITGQINILSAQAYTDLAMSFQNIDLPLFNPYSGKFAGYSIAQGKLTTQMHYHVENRQLNATHHVVIDQLEFGPATDSKQAVPLPIRLAAALLKDRHGVITLDLPVSGSLSDPSFSIGPIVWKVFVGLIRHIVTAPFSWLGSLFGGDGSSLAYVDFAPGSATLDVNNTHKLAQLSQALIQRPQLRLDIPLHTLSEADDRAIAHAALDQAVAAVTAAGAGDSGTPGRAGTGTSRSKRRGGAHATAAIAQPPTRLAALAMLYGRQFKTAPQYPPDAVSDEQHTAWLEQQLLPQYGPPRQQRDALGLARATTTQMAVLAGGQVAATRVFFTQRASGGGSAGSVRMELQLQ